MPGTFANIHLISESALAAASAIQAPKCLTSAQTARLFASSTRRLSDADRVISAAGVPHATCLFIFIPRGLSLETRNWKSKGGKSLFLPCSIMFLGYVRANSVQKKQNCPHEALGVPIHRDSWACERWEQRSEFRLPPAWIFIEQARFSAPSKLICRMLAILPGTEENPSDWDPS